MRQMILVLAFAMIGGCSSNDSGSDSKIRLNEILAASDASPDWLELYNSGDSEVDLSGYELRDSSNFWAFSEGKLAAGEFLQVICDGSGVAGKTGFKLTAKGEQVSVHDPDGALVDKVVFPALQRETSWGRIPDGDGEWTALKTPSPGKANIEGAPSDGSITVPDAGPKDAKPDANKPAPDLAPDIIQPDVGDPDLGPDLGPDFGPDLGPDLEPDSGSDLGSDGTT